MLSYCRIPSYFLPYTLTILCLFGSHFLLSQSRTDSLLVQLKKAPEEGRAAIYNELSAIHSENTPEKAIQFAEQALKFSRKYDDKRNEAVSLQNLCLGYLFNDIYDKALVNGLASLEIFEQLGKAEDIAYILSTLGWLYYDIQNADLALQYHQKVLDIYLSLDDKENISFGYNSLGLVYSLKEDYETALYHYLQSLKIAQENQLIHREATAHSNLGMTYSSLGSFDLALKHLQESLNLRSNSSSTLSMAEVYNQIGKVYLGTGQYEKSEASLLKARSLIEQLTSKSSKEKLMDNYEYYSDLYAGKGEYEKAYEAFKKHSELRNNILSEDKSNRLSEMRILYETEKKENEIQLLESQKRIDRFFRNASVIGLILLIIITYLSISKLRSKNQKAKLEKENLKDKLDFKNTELTTFALHISQRNEMLNRFIESLSNIEKNAENPTSDQIRKLTHQIEQSKTINQDLEDFHINVEKEYKDFFYNLEKKFPDLTENDKRLSAQLRLNLSNKDIAGLNNVAIKSVEMARYRLRKKFNLDPKDNIAEFLRQL